MSMIGYTPLHMLKPPRCHHFPPLCHLYQISKKINGFNSKYFPSYVGDKTWTGKIVKVRKTLKIKRQKSCEYIKRYVWWKLLPIDNLRKRFHCSKLWHFQIKMVIFESKWPDFDSKWAFFNIKNDDLNFLWKFSLIFTRKCHFPEFNWIFY